MRCKWTLRGDAQERQEGPPPTGQAGAEQAGHGREQEAAGEEGGRRAEEAGPGAGGEAGQGGRPGAGRE